MPREEPTTAHPFVDSGTYRVREGNSARLLVDGEPAFRRVYEAIEVARASVWVSITFMWPSFVMPDGRGTALDVLARAAARGLDVRLIFWRPDDETASLRTNAFWGAPEHLEQLDAAGTGVSVRWDRAQAGHCQHQKVWMLDAGLPSQVAFMGGINLNPHSLAAPGHAGEGQNHDVYVELAGPCLADVQHDFVQRWNEASERGVPGGTRGERGGEDLPYPTALPACAGTAAVQVQRTVAAGKYTVGRAPVGWRGFDAGAGERTILRQYVVALGAARSAVYLENQYVEVPEIVAALRGALERGVEVVLLLPANPALSSAAYATPERRAFFAARAALDDFPNFTLTGLAGLGGDGKRKPVYVHSKLMLVDDAFALIGSANLHRFSLFGNGESSAAIRSPEHVGAFRRELFEEHIGLGTADLDAAAALREFGRVARENAARLAAGDAAWQGLAFRMRFATYGLSTTGLI
ncbi:MAG: phosphatidylserine/phosphatidylglycerophosphate/cardiolipin synthase family protein [Trueperaceae bacterium]|nr:phosphatidylserine/phosphatidylglycerophosphate/cardiolipin synthase family protein [Trueperaceae bacterium]MCW5819702.1 phosphatidylserine/phosphatidylglycerophosphate/cardiolipin synthase family protein [Trueperaceae bacterium]